VPLVFGGPHDEVRLGNAAGRAIQEILRSPWRLFKNPDVTIASWLASVSPSSAPDLLSYILFEPEFIDEAIRAGVKDAESLHSDYPDPKSLWDSLRAKEIRKKIARGKASPNDRPSATNPLS
jgi:NTE family protein